METSQQLKLFARQTTQIPIENINSPQSLMQNGANKIVNPNRFLYIFTNVMKFEVFPELISVAFP